MLYQVVTPLDGRVWATTPHLDRAESLAKILNAYVWEVKS